MKKAYSAPKLKMIVNIAVLTQGANIGSVKDILVEGTHPKVFH